MASIRQLVDCLTTEQHCDLWCEQAHRGRERGRNEGREGRKKKKHSVRLGTEPLNQRRRCGGYFTRRLLQATLRQLGQHPMFAILTCAQWYLYLSKTDEIAHLQISSRACQHQHRFRSDVFVQSPIPTLCSIRPCAAACPKKQKEKSVNCVWWRFRETRLNLNARTPSSIMTSSIVSQTILHAQSRGVQQ